MGWEGGRDKGEVVVVGGGGRLVGGGRGACIGNTTMHHRSVFVLLQQNVARSTELKRIFLDPFRSKVKTFLLFQDKRPAMLFPSRASLLLRHRKHLFVICFKLGL